MTVSVAIATYNRARMVTQAIQAALDQTPAPVEIVIADDASTDATVAVVNEMARRDGRVRLIRRSVNSGGAANWNAAVDQTRGDYIAWCSDDDRFLPGHLCASVAYLEQHPGVGMVHSGFVDATEAHGRSEWIPRQLRSQQPLIVNAKNWIPYMIHYYNWPFHPSTLVFRRAVWERTGPCDSRYALADTDWFVRVAENFSIALLPRHGVLNRRHGGNWSNRIGSARMQLEIFSIVDHAIGRRFPRALRDGPGRILWRTIWRANVRLRLGWTLAMRLAGGHQPAASAAWQALASGTGRKAPGWLQRTGMAAIRGWCAGRESPGLQDSVTPL